MSLCPEAVVAVTQSAAVGAVGAGSIGLLLLYLVRDDDWTFASTRRESAMTVVATALGIVGGSATILSSRTSIQALTRESFSAELLLGGLVLVPLVVVFLCIRRILVRRVHLWLGKQPEPREALLSSEGLSEENRRIERLMSKGYAAFLGTLVAALLVVAWIFLPDRCPDSVPTAADPAVSSTPSVSP